MELDIKMSRMSSRLPRAPARALIMQTHLYTTPDTHQPRSKVRARHRAERSLLQRRRPAQQGLQLCLLSTKLPVDERVSLIPALCGLVRLLLTRALVCRYRDEIPFCYCGGTTRDRYLYGIYIHN
jgi:hypothetical protein